MSKSTAIGVFFCLVLFAVQSFGQARTTVQDGTWNDPDTWGGVAPPDFNVGTITVNHNVTVTADVSINQTVVALPGTLTIDPSITVTLIAVGGSTELTVAGTLIINGSVINSGASTITYSGASLVNNGILNIGTNTLTWSGIGTLSGTGSTTVGDLNVSLGGATFTYTASGDLTLNDDILGAGIFDSSGGGDVIFVGAGSAISGAGAKIFNNVVVTGIMTPGANISYTVFGNITVDGTLNDGSGTSTTTFSGTTLISGSGTIIDFFNVVIDPGATVTYNTNIRIFGVTFIGNGDIATDSPNSSAILSVISLAFSGTGLKDFTNVTIGTGPTTSTVDFTIRGDLVLTGTLTQTSGTVTFAGTSTKTGTGVCVFNNVLVNPGASFASTTGHTINGAFTNNGTVNFTGGTLTLGASSATTLTNPLATTTFFALTTTAGATITDAPASNLTISSNFVGAANYVSLGTTTFNGTTSLSGVGAKTFNNLVVTGTLTPLANISYTVNGNVTVSGTLNDGSGTSNTTFSGTTIISGAGIKDFFNVTINLGATVTYSSNITFNGDTFVGNGSLTTDSPTSPAIITFTTIALSGAGTKDFTNVTIATGASTTPNVDFTIRGNLVVTGTMTQTAGTVTFAGTTAKSGGGACTFNNVTVNSGSTFNSTTSHTINGAFTNDGTVNFNAGTLTLGASSVTTLTNPLGSTRFDALTTIAGATITDAPTTNLTITGNFVGGANYISLGTTTFDETVAMSGAGSKTFNNLVVNGVSFTPNNAYTVNGNVSGTGVLAAGNNTATFAGTSSLISGSGAKNFFNITVNPGTNVTYSSSVIVSGATATINGSLTSVSAAPITFTSVNVLGAGAKDFDGVTIEAGATLISTAYSIRGNLTITGTLTSTGTATFAGSTTVSGLGSSLFTDVIINAASSLTLSAGIIRVNGNINNSGTINPGSGTLQFGGNTTITNGGTINLNIVEIIGGTTLTAPNNTIGIAGNFISTGTFNNGGGTILFNGTTNLTANEVYNNIEVTGTVTGTNNQTVAGSMINNGSFSVGTAAALTWSGTGILSGSGITTVGDLTVNGAFTSTATGDLIVNDDIQGGGTFDASGSAGNVIFIGAASALSGSTPKIFNNLVVDSPGILTPTPGTSYNVNGNLSGSGVLNAGTGTTTFIGTTIISGSGAKNFNNLTINSGAIVTASIALNVLGDFTNDGTFNAGTETVTFSGTATQDIQGTSTTTFNNININNVTAFVNVQSNQNLRGILTLEPASFFDADGAGTGVFTLLSTSSIPVADGAIAAIPADATFTGNITAQRFMKNAGEVNRYISAPVASMPASQLDFTKTNNSIRYYNEAVPGAIGLGYTSLPLVSSFQIGLGYLAYMYNAVDLTWDATGPINQGSIPLPVSFTASSAGPDVDGWNLVGNPYPSGVIWTNGAGWTVNASIDPVISVPDLSIGTGYPTYYHVSNFEDPGTGDLPNDFIAMGQAFWVHANAAGPILTVNESAKSPATGGNFYRKASSSSEQLIIAINNGKYQDRSFLKLNDKATEDYDRKFDGYKLKNEEMNIYLIDNAQRSLVMHTLSEIPGDMRIPLGVEVMVAGEYEITFSNADMFSASPGLFLIDSFEGQSIPVTSEKGYTFKIQDATKPVKDRFYLSRNTVIAEKKMSDWLQAFPNPVKDELTIVIPSNETAKVTLFDSTGAMIWADEIKGTGKVDLRNYPSGMFLLKVLHGKEVVVKKIMK